MTASTLLVIIIGVSVFAVFAAFAGSLAWAQLHARPAAVPVVRPKRRPF